MRPIARLAPFAALVGVVAALHHRVLFLGETYVLRDALRFTLPSREALAAALAGGRVPEWQDAVGFGVPFAANPLHGVVAPLGWTLALLPSASGADLYALLNLLVAAAGTAALSGRLGASAWGATLAGATLAASGYVGSAFANNLVPAIAWTPWVAWAADRLAARRDGEARTGPVLLLAAILALQLLSGEPASAILAGLLAGVVVVTRAPRPAGAIAGVGAASLLALPLAAIALFPGLALLSESARAGGLPSALGEHWSMHPLRVVEWIWPLAFGAPGSEGWLARVVLSQAPGDPCWSFSLAVGAPVLVLAAAVPGRARRLLVAGSILFVLLALGRYTPAYPLFRAVFPPEQLARFPEKYIYGALVIWAALAGVGFTQVLEKAAVTRGAIVAAWGSAIALGASVGLLAANRAAAAAFLSARAGSVDAELGLEFAVRGGLVATGGALAFAVAIQLRRTALGARVSPALGASGVLVPLVLAGWMGTPLASREVISRAPVLLAAIDRPAPGAPLPRLLRGPQLTERTRHDDGNSLAASFHETLAVNVPARFGFAALPGFDPASSRRFDRLWNELFPRLSWEALTGLLGVDVLAVEDALVEQTGLAREAPSVQGWTVLRPRVHRPRAFVTARWRVAPDADAALADLTSPGRTRDLSVVTLVEGEAPVAIATAAEPTACAVERRRPEEIALRCDSPAGGIAVLLEEASPGWSAHEGARELPLLLADGLFRAASIGPGPREVVFRYRTPGLRTGALVSLGAWVGLLVVALALARLRARAGGRPEGRFSREDL